MDKISNNDGMNPIPYCNNTQIIDKDSSDRDVAAAGWSGNKGTKGAFLAGIEFAVENYDRNLKEKISNKYYVNSETKYPPLSRYKSQGREIAEEICSEQPEFNIEMINNEKICP